MKNLTQKFLFFFLLSIMSFAQQRNISGTVTDENNLPLPGATIQVKTTYNGVVTDFDGNYSLVLKPEDKFIIISYVGYESQEIEVGNQKVINTSLTPKIETLKDVVFIGYGEVKKEDITGAITSIKPNDATKNQAQGIESVLQGKAAGVVINSTGFEPTSPINIQIRGVNTLSMGNQPLYVVDGIIIDSANEAELDPLEGGNSSLSAQNGLAGINPKDIESIEILKDASATAIYGSRASNGVILIITKKGKTGKAKFNYNVTTRIGEVTRTIDVLDGKGFAEYQNTSKSLKNQTLNYTIDENGNVFDVNSNPLQTVNWSDEIFKTSVSYNHRLSVSGGNDKNTYYFALGNTKNEGVVPNASSKMTDFNLNLSNQLNDRLTFDTKISTAFIKNSASKGTEDLGGTNNNMVRQIVNGVPFLGVVDNIPDGVDEANVIDGPNAWIQDYDDLSEEIRLLGSLKAEYKISETFKYRIQFGSDYRKKERKLWYGLSLFRGALFNGEAGVSQIERFRYNLDNTLMFNKKFNKNHRINGTLGFILDEKNLKSYTYSAKDFQNTDLRADGIAYGNITTGLRYQWQAESIMSLIGRMNYTLANRYNFTATIRRDGSSKFIDENRWGNFPSFAFAWQINREKFLRKFSKLNNAKLRLGWGITGNQNTANYQYITNYDETANPVPNPDGTGSLGIISINLANSQLKWETTYQTNVGLDLGFFDDRLTATVDLYQKNTKDLAQFFPIAPSDGGYERVYANIGELENKGFEIGITADIIKNDNLKWSVYGNYSSYRNKIKNLGYQQQQIGDLYAAAYTGDQISGGNYFKTIANIFAEGYAAGLFFGYETDGIISSDEQLANAPTYFGNNPQLGDINLVDKNGDGNITDADRTIIGDPNPDFTYGFGTQVEYKNFSVNVAFNGVYGKDIANGNLVREAYADGSNVNIRPEAYYDAWSVDNPNGQYPRVNNTQIQQLGFTDREIQDGSFLRLQNVTFGYKVPFNDKSFFESLDLSISGYNLLLLTKYNGYDPEVDSFSWDPYRRSVDWQSFPNQRSYSIGVNLTF